MSRKRSIRRFLKASYPEYVTYQDCIDAGCDRFETTEYLGQLHDLGRLGMKNLSLDTDNPRYETNSRFGLKLTIGYREEKA